MLGIPESTRVTLPDGRGIWELWAGWAQHLEAHAARYWAERRQWEQAKQARRRAR